MGWGMQCPYKFFQKMLIVGKCERDYLPYGTHLEYRRQRVLSKSETNARVCVDKSRYNRNWCTSDSLGVQQ